MTSSQSSSGHRPSYRRSFQLKRLIRRSALGLAAAAVVLGISRSGANTEAPERGIGFTPIAVGTPASAIHVTRSSSDDRVNGQTQRESIGGKHVDSSITLVPSTRTSFMASWSAVEGATGYRLDVSTSPRFESFVKGYHDLDVGVATGRVVSALEQGTTYYYRVRAYAVSGISANSTVMSATTSPSQGLIIRAVFDSSITSSRTAGSIEAAINRSIAIYESLFRDPVTITILFRYSPNGPDGRAVSGLSQSNSSVYPVRWQTYIDALVANAKSKNDLTAIDSLPIYSLSSYIVIASANGRAVGLNTPPTMFANGTVGRGGGYDGIVTVNSANPFQFDRPVQYYDAQRAIEHEIDEVIGMGSSVYRGNDLRPQDLFSWSAWENRNFSGPFNRYFSVDLGKTKIVAFNDDITGDLGDWSSGSCPQTTPYVQNAFACASQASDITATSPEGITLDVIGYDPVSGNVSVDLSRSHAIVADFNGDGYPDYLIYNRATRQTAIWYLDEDGIIGGDYGPTIAVGWSLVDAADLDGDGYPDYILVNRTTGQTAIWYLSGATFLRGAYAPSIPTNWKLILTRDFNNDGKPDYVLYNLITHQTALWYLNNNVLAGGAYGPTLPDSWALVGAADFNHDGNQDYLLYNASTKKSAIWYLSGPNFVSGQYGPTMDVAATELVGAADFPLHVDHNGNPDFVLFTPDTLEAGIWYLDNNLGVEAAHYGPTLPSGWSLIIR